MGKITLSQIAEMAEVSTATVSRVINHHPYVRDEIRERVRQIIQETGYHPNPAARSLARQCSNIIGLVIPQAVQQLFLDPYFPLLIQGITHVCSENAYTSSLYMFHTAEEETTLYSRIMQAHTFDGLIVTATQTGNPLVQQLLDDHIPFVMVGKHDNPLVNSVDADNIGGGYNATCHLIDLGHRRVGIIAGPGNNEAANDRLRGYKNALLERGVAIDEALIMHGDYTEMSGYAAMQQLLSQDPDSVFVSSDTMAMGALRALHAAQVSIPDDIAVMGFDDLPASAVTEPPLTTIRQPIQRTGATAVELLIDIIENGGEPPRQIKLPTELVIRESCGALR